MGTTTAGRAHSSWYDIRMIPTAVLFDLDGVFIETERETFRYYQRWLRERYGYTLADDAFRFKAGRKSARFFADAFTAADRARLPLEQMLQEKRRDFIAHPERFARQMEGGREVLEQLQHRSYPLALVSQNEPQMIRAVLDWLNLGAYFQVLLSIADIQKKKPDPEIYLLAAQRLGQDPTTCVGIEDSLDGVGAVKNAGMYCIGVAHDYMPPGTLDRADAVVRRLAELPSVIASIGVPAQR